MSAVTLIPGRSVAPDTLDVWCQRRQEVFQRKYRGRISAPIGIIVQAQPGRSRPSDAEPASPCLRFWGPSPPQRREPGCNG
jgi:hypothetical protein